MASIVSTRKSLRKIPAFRSLPSQELESIQERMVTRSYKPGEVLWRTHGRTGFSGFIQSGEIDIEVQIGGVVIRSTRLRAGDALPPLNRKRRSQRATTLARAVTDVSLCLVPNAKTADSPFRQSDGDSRTHSIVFAARHIWLSRVWPLLILLLIIGLARADIIRISSGLLYLASNHEGYYSPNDPRSLKLLKYAERMDTGAAFAYNEEGYRWFQQKKLLDAESAFRQAVKKDPANASALNNAAITYFTLGDVPLSTLYLRQAVEQDPNNAITRYNLGIILMEQNNQTGAMREFREVGFIDMGAASPHVQQAFLYTQMGDYANAEQRARTAIQLDPSQAPVHLMLAIALYNQGKYAEALASIADTLSIEPENRVAGFYKALILGRMEQYNAALSTLKMLKESSTDSQESARISVEIEAIQRSISESEASVP